MFFPRGRLPDSRLNQGATKAVATNLQYLQRIVTSCVSNHSLIWIAMPEIVPRSARFRLAQPGLSIRLVLRLDLFFEPFPWSIQRRDVMRLAFESANHRNDKKHERSETKNSRAKIAARNQSQKRKRARDNQNRQLQRQALRRMKTRVRFSARDE